MRHKTNPFLLLCSKIIFFLIEFQANHTLCVAYCSEEKLIAILYIIHFFQLAL